MQNNAWTDENDTGGVGSVRVGIVKHQYPAQCAVEVSFPDVDDGEFVSFKLPVLQHCAGSKAKGWWMPAIDDQVLVCFLPYAPDFGFVVGSFYAESDSMPSSDAEDVSITFANGDAIAYKASDRKLECKVGSTSVKVSDGLVECGNGSGKFVALAPDVKSQLDAIKSALDTIQQTYGTHTHNCTSPGSPSGPALQPIIHGYTVGDVAASHVKAD